MLWLIFGSLTYLGVTALFGLRVYTRLLQSYANWNQGAPPTDEALAEIRLRAWKLALTWPAVLVLIFVTVWTLFWAWPLFLAIEKEKHREDSTKP